MGFSVFSQPLTRLRLGAYIAAGAGTGAVMAGRDHRTSGAVAGAAAGLGVGAAHAFGGAAAEALGVNGTAGMLKSAFQNSDGVINGVKDAASIARMSAMAATQEIRGAYGVAGGGWKGVKASASMAKMFGAGTARAALKNPNIDSGVASLVGRAAGVLGRIRG